MQQLQLNPKNTHFLEEVIVLLVSLIVWLCSIIKPSNSVYYEPISVAYMQRVQTKPGLLCIDHVCILYISHTHTYTCTYLTCRNCLHHHT